MKTDAPRLGRAARLRDIMPWPSAADVAPVDPPTGQLSGPLTAVQQPPRADEVARLNAALDRLPADQRLAVELRYRHAKPVAEVAAALDCTPPAAAGLIRRGVAALQLALADPWP